MGYVRGNYICENCNKRSPVDKKIKDLRFGWCLHLFNIFTDNDTHEGRGEKTKAKTNSRYCRVPLDVLVVRFFPLFPICLLSCVGLQFVIKKWLRWRLCQPPYWWSNNSPQHWCRNNNPQRCSSEQFASGCVIASRKELNILVGTDYRICKANSQQSHW